MSPWKNRIDMIKGYDFIRNIEGSVSYEQAKNAAYANKLNGSHGNSYVLYLS